MIVSVHLYSQSSPVKYDDVINTYQKGSFFCVRLSDDIVHKFPLKHVFRVIEDSKTTSPVVTEATEEPNRKDWYLEELKAELEMTRQWIENLVIEGR